MKYICKNTEPEVLANFKARANNNWKLSYSKFKKKGTIKKEFQNCLILEQGHLCCYCGMRISQTDSHIEHFKPQREYPDLELDYFNMLVSCKNQIEQKEPKHCGFAKENWFDNKLLVSPLIADCDNFFEYAADGQILPSKEIEKATAATETIERLGLNIRKLQATRASAIAGIYGEELELILSEEEIDKLIHDYSKTDKDGQYQPYCQIILYVLNQDKMDRFKRSI